MAGSSENIERKLSLDEVLSYSSSDQSVNIRTLPEGDKIARQLWQACAQGDLKTVKEVLETNNLSVNVRLFQNTTPLMVAAEYNQPRLVSFLLNQRGIDVSLMGQDGQTALNLALQMWYNFKNPNYEIASNLIRAGANIDQITFTNTLLITAWQNENQAAADFLIVLFGANIQMNEELFNSTDQRFRAFNRERALHQIALSKQRWHACLNNAQNLGIGIEELCFSRRLANDIGSNIASFLLERNDLLVQTFNKTRNSTRRLLPEQAPAMPRTLLFRGNFENLPRHFVNEIVWQQWANNYNREFPKRETAGYGPGAMVVYKR